MRDLYAHSIALIRAHQSDGGAYVASPTFATYNYCWFRDGTYIAYAMDLVGQHASARRFYDWAAAMVARRADAVERAIVAAPQGQPAPADLLDTRYTLDGAVGDDDWPNFQLDGFGTLLWGMRQHLALGDAALPEHWRTAADLLARYLGALWRLPCYDCWEEFGDKVHTATLAALYGGLNAAAALLDEPRHAQAAAEIKQFVLSSCVNGTSLSKFVGSTMVDASLVHVATPYRLLEPEDPLMRATIARIEAELRRNDGGVHRYADDSYYGGGEWLLLTAYLGWYYVECGATARARELLDWVERNASSAGDMPEQVAANLNHPEMLAAWNARWGTSASPLLWSHAAYLTLHSLLHSQ
ncbi:MAG TPA: glycoside hydrolase family 15 protein [Kouleothrix sp.]|uniref:glycoside hydrolase family 15 protein n=1 Tax=Kouleothrix sp. TaxID=2779161 RepID=UPI002BCE0A87|nr:glycoside hydrolase family 15 protein [Kouleothrix sp.]